MNSYFLAVFGSLALLGLSVLQHAGIALCFYAALLLAANVWQLQRARAVEARRRTRVTRALTWLERGDLSLEQLLEIRSLLDPAGAGRKTGRPR